MSSPDDGLTPEQKVFLQAYFVEYIDAAKPIPRNAVAIKATLALARELEVTAKDDIAQLRKVLAF
ncbi:hypothetical protein QCA50_016992 [Cerrena zonata]|uniref:Uncharacterized protein n=1 Tax=Cerrena zonata TaxID=2478898 RepID=A0AAW0FHH6_9APHY